MRCLVIGGRKNEERPMAFHSFAELKRVRVPNLGATAVDSISGSPRVGVRLISLTGNSQNLLRGQHPRHGLRRTLGAAHPSQEVEA